MGRGGWVATAASLMALLPDAGAAQACAAGDRIGSMGITGIQCERCRFFSREDGRPPVFWTEPVVRGIDPDLPGARVLREGDAIVAVDDELITTARGQAAYARLPLSGEVRVRVRRNGELRDLEVPVAAVCPASPSLAPVVAGRSIPVPPGPPAIPPVPAVPSVRAAPAAPVAPAAAVPPIPPLPPGPDARLGFGFRCGPCTQHRAQGEIVWSFSNPPEVTGVQEDGPAWAAGLRPGDRIVRVDGADVTSDEGGRRFGAIRPGDRVRWTVERDGRTLDVTSLALPQDVRAVSPPAASAPAVADVLRYSGRVGDALVEVRGARVVVVEDGSAIVIRTGDTEIRIRVAGGDSR